METKTQVSWVLAHVKPLQAVPTASEQNRDTICRRSEVFKLILDAAEMRFVDFGNIDCFVKDLHFQEFCEHRSSSDTLGSDILIAGTKIVLQKSKRSTSL